MGKTARPQQRGPSPAAELTRIEEANVARLGLISIQERIPESYTSWSVAFETDGRPARLTCDALAKYGGVPHGLDGDISTALVDLYHESGAPASGVLHTTPYQILRRAGLDVSGRYYQNLLQTLFRLRTTTYTASEAWRDHGRGNWTTVTFNYLAELEFTSDSDKTQLSSTSALKVRLAEPIVRSIRARYTKPLDLDFLTSLDRPLTRALYRLLDARRYGTEEPREALERYTVGLLEWGEACKIVDRRANKIRATLEGAHDELKTRGYLREVAYEGRGKKQTITYLFAEAGVPPPPTGVLAKLLAHRVSSPVASKLLTAHGEAHVQARLERFERLLASGYKARNRSALLVDVIRDDADKYPEPALPPTRPRADTAPSYMPTLDEAASDGGPPEQQVEAAVKTLQFLLRERLSVSEYALLRMGLIIGQPSPKEATRAAAQAKAEGTLDQFTAQLLDVLHALHARR